MDFSLHNVKIKQLRRVMRNNVLKHSFKVYNRCDRVPTFPLGVPSDAAGPDRWL